MTTFIDRDSFAEMHPEQHSTPQKKESDNLPDTSGVIEGITQSFVSSRDIECVRTVLSSTVAGRSGLMVVDQDTIHPRMFDPNISEVLADIRERRQIVTDYTPRGTLYLADYLPKIIDLEATTPDVIGAFAVAKTISETLLQTNRRGEGKDIFPTSDFIGARVENSLIRDVPLPSDHSKPSGKQILTSSTLPVIEAGRINEVPDNIYNPFCVVVNSSTTKDDLRVIAEKLTGNQDNSRNKIVFSLDFKPSETKDSLQYVLQSIKNLNLGSILIWNDRSLNGMGFGAESKDEITEVIIENIREIGKTFIKLDMQMRGIHLMPTTKDYAIGKKVSNEYRTTKLTAALNGILQVLSSERK